jgi:hypothetical protein
MRAGWAGVLAAAVAACEQGGSPEVAIPTTTLLLRVGVEGPGTIEASGLPLDCIDGCEVHIPSGTVVHLTPRANLAATFDGWQGACGGAGACDLTVTRAAEVTARFSASDPCAGIMPASMGASVSATLPPPGSRRYCFAATSDGQGNVAHQVYGMGPAVWQVYAPDGTPMGRLLDVFEVAEQDSGFHGTGYNGFTAWNAAGTLVAQEQSVASVGSVATWMFPARTTGSVAVSTDSWGCPNGRTGHSTVNVWRFAASGSVTSVVDIGGTGCPSSASGAITGLSDDRDNTFVALNTGCCGDVFGLPPERVIARWVDAGGRPLTPWTDVAEAGNIEVAPLIGGGVVLRAGEWIASFASGSATPAAAPTFIPAYHRVAIVRGGRAYAVVPTLGWSRDPAIELYSPAGGHCGTLEFPTGVGLYVGRDGTVISIGKDDWCAATWWPHLLR